MQRRPHHERDRELDERDYPYRTHNNNGSRGPGLASAPGPGQDVFESGYRREGYSDSLHQPGRDAYDGGQRERYR